MIDYYDLAQLADKILEIADDDMPVLAEIIEDLDPETRSELLFSDFLNAYQVFYYYFREVPDILVDERLSLVPASAVRKGVLAEERDLLELVFIVPDETPEILVSDGEEILQRFIGKNAYRDAVGWADEQA
ncbi:hypothetical protein AZH53_04950 [Methanomicrobiaceae archaeon CYW5]|uniref:hypothetical protein n=1 Tax=Methanovulcanius yangii TaxID=1789227 RepID=UPI0029C9DF0E|nr:hypothetical protein [Methanovulcanius yangii]MBT8507765.1 hypothetical protein [Methanovulcanius yangii]